MWKRSRKRKHQLQRPLVPADKQEKSREPLKAVCDSMRGWQRASPFLSI
jgi:hypothetical protein